MKLKHLRIQNFKSLRDLSIEDPNDFLVFAGPQGSGKSNLVDAMDFMSRSLRLNPKEAVRHHGGWESVRNLNSILEGVISFQIEAIANVKDADVFERHRYGELFAQYSLVIKHEFQNQSKALDGSWSLDGTSKLDGKSNIVDFQKKEKIRVEGINGQEVIGDPLDLLKSSDWTEFVYSIRHYRINPALILQPSLQRFDDSELDTWGQNLALVLNRLERNDDIREQVLEWMQMSVPELEQVRTIEQKLDGHVGMLFKFKGYEKEFPPHLISEGTMYLLCMLVAILDRHKHGITIIEEPERGLHPYLIQQLVEFFREESKKAPIWLTTHNETLIRGLQPQELMLMDKVNGETVLKSAKDYKSNGLSLDRAWLSNVLDGGLPW